MRSRKLMHVIIAVCIMVVLVTPSQGCFLVDIWNIIPNSIWITEILQSGPISYSSWQVGVLVGILLSDPNPPSHNTGTGGTSTGGDPVNLSTGSDSYLPGPDISAYNAIGPGAVYQRNFYTEVARAGYGSPGLTVGWVDNFDITIHETSEDAWEPLILVHPNLSVDKLGPITENGEPTGEFGIPQSGPYCIVGDPSETEGKWNSITITWKQGQVSWVFTPTNETYVAGEEIYVLSRIMNRMGKYIQINRTASPDFLLTTVTDDAATPNTLLTFDYDENDRLESVTDAYDRKVTYTFETDYFGGTEQITCLTAVSQIASTGTTNPPARATYDYDVFDGYAAFEEQPHLISISFPSPTGAGMSTQTVNFDTSTGKASSIVDANGNQRVYTYLTSTTTKVEVKNSSNTVEQWWIQHFEPISEFYRSTGVEDSDSNRTTLVYGDYNAPCSPTRVTDKSGMVTLYYYDSHGNVSLIMNPRDTWISFEYDYDDFPLGRLTSVELFKPSTYYQRTLATYTYDETYGLLETATTLKPGTTDESTVTTTYEYDWDDPEMSGEPVLGNLWRITAPGNNADSSIVTTFNYLEDGQYSQSNKLGQPLTITDNLGHVTHFRYDERGQVISTIDALGNETKQVYNIAGQPVLTVAPSTQ